MLAPLVSLSSSALNTVRPGIFPAGESAGSERFHGGLRLVEGPCPISVGRVVLESGMFAPGTVSVEYDLHCATIVE